MLKNEVLTVAGGLTAYAAECQNGFEHRHSARGDPPWQDERCDLIKDILRDMAELEGGAPAAELTEQFERRLEESSRCSAVKLSGSAQQGSFTYALKCYAEELRRISGDHRRQLWRAKELLKDMTLHPMWGQNLGLWELRQAVEKVLLELTAHQPLRFTRLCLGDARGALVDFVSGTALDEESVMGTELFQQLSEEYPEVEVWPARCAVYLCNGWGAVRDADEFDLQIMRSEGSRFLERKGVRPTGERSELEISSAPVMRVAMAM